MDKIKKSGNNPITAERTGYPALLSHDINNIARELLGKSGFVSVDVISSWRSIVGEKIADCSVPLKIKFPKGKNQGGILHISVGGSAFVQYIAYQKADILEKVNQYFGYDAVSDLKIIPGLYTAKEVKTEPLSANKNISAKETELPSAIQTALDTMEDGDLKIRLRNLAKTYIKTDND